MVAKKTMWIFLALATLGVACAKHSDLEVQEKPERLTAKVTAQPPIGQVPLTVSFDASGSVDPQGGPLSYAWIFDDGSFASGRAVERTFSRVGTYAVALKVTNDQGETDTAWAVVIVNREGATR